MEKSDHDTYLIFFMGGIPDEDRDHSIRSQEGGGGHSQKRGGAGGKKVGEYEGPKQLSLCAEGGESGQSTLTKNEGKKKTGA